MLRLSAWGQRREHAVGWNSVKVALFGTEPLLMRTPLCLEKRVSELSHSGVIFYLIN